MRPWIKVINFVMFQDRVGRVEERIFNGKRYLFLIVNEMAFSDAILAVIHENLWLSRELDPRYFDINVETVKRVGLHRAAICDSEPTIYIPLGENLVRISYTVGNLSVAFPVSKFIEEALLHFEADPVLFLCDTVERQEEFERRWEEMLGSLENSVNQDTAVG